MEQIPEGYEIYENPNGKVYLRKILKKSIKDEEIKVIEKAMRKCCPIQNFKLDIKKEFVYIYTVSTSINELDLLSPLIGNSEKYKDYETVMRLQLMDEQSRIFEIERFCFLSGIEDWIYLDDSDNLQELVEEYVRHIGQESLYELFY